MMAEEHLVASRAGRGWAAVRFQIQSRFGPPRPVSLALYHRPVSLGAWLVPVVQPPLAFSARSASQ